MSHENLYPIVGLQFNVSDASPTINDISGPSRLLKRRLIKEFLSQTDPAKLPCPTFVALHDKAVEEDSKNIISVFKEHPRSGNKHELTSIHSKDSRGVCFLYDREAVTYLNDFDLRAEDVILDTTTRDNTGGKLLARVSGGLFQHKESTQFIVAFSYHGFDKAKAEMKIGYLIGIYNFVF
jgi:hypothetical protein